MAGWGKRTVATLVGMGLGGATYFAGSKAAPWLAEKMPNVFGKYYSTPILIGAVGLLVRGKKEQGFRPEAGTALAASAGVLLAQGYYANAATQPAAQPAAASGFSTPYMQSSAGYPMVQGEAGRSYGDAGLTNYRRPLPRRSEAGALYT